MSILKDPKSLLKITSAILIAVISIFIVSNYVTSSGIISNYVASVDSSKDTD